MFQVGEDLETVKTTYLALNSQLVTELPVLVQVNKSSPPVCSLISVVFYSPVYLLDSILLFTCMFLFSYLPAGFYSPLYL